MDPLFIWHNRTSQTPRTGTWRHSARTPEVPESPFGSQARRQVLLVHDDRMDDVEFCYWRLGRRFDRVALRRLSFVARRVRLVEVCGTRRRDFSGNKPRLYLLLYEEWNKARRKPRFKQAERYGRIRITARA